MAKFGHQRHKSPTSLARPRELIVACPPMRSNVNLSRIVRVASCCGVPKLIACGNAKVDPKIARDGIEQVEIVRRRTLLPVLKELRDEGYCLVGLEQTSSSTSLFEFMFPRKTVLVVGHERTGIAEDILEMLDEVVEIPVYGLPYSFNVATSVAMSLYEYCRQYPGG